MLQFQPIGFGQRDIETSLGAMVYYTPVATPWDVDEQRPTMIFLHSLGGGSSAYEWSKVYPAFASDYRVIAPDLIGWGQSDHPAKEYRPEAYFTVITELIEQSASAPVIVCASSLTAGLVIRLAIQRPDLFQRLLLVSPSGYNEFGLDYGRNIAAQLAGTPVIDRLLYTLGAANELAVRNFLQQFLFAERSRLTNEIVEAYLASALQPNAEYAALASLRGDLCFDLSLYIDRLKTPTAFFWGEAARFSSVEIGKRLGQINPTAIEALYAIANTGVLPHLETPEVVIGLMWSYLYKM
ncbi:alpha/beta hydrolase [Oscillatoria sp. FACHB-1407]|uniref:alpha/beta fold hydrolase n=1 Tax=Oscillatoria sp. FACHB-1407 TaxID=2692847 RepID=UPI0016896DA1|nr:alpha/beta hydrolase [Oscillatoria sp. FACHB-1407]MBD2462470.1 alpha/beta hydrolase [Oscillatoria sp. FACHB-1407]